jgi:hypothetical protein
MTMKFTLLSRAFVLTVASAVLAACGGDGSDEQTGMLKLSITDAPVDAADEVVVQFAGVELKPRGGRAFSIDFVDPAATPPNTRPSIFSTTRAQPAPCSCRRRRCLPVSTSGYA